MLITWPIAIVCLYAFPVSADEIQYKQIAHTRFVFNALVGLKTILCNK